MGQFCSTDNSKHPGDEDNYAALVSKFNSRRASGKGAYGATTHRTSMDNTVRVASHVASQDEDSWHLVSPSDSAMHNNNNNNNNNNNTTGLPSSPTKDDSTNSVMLYDIQYRMTNSHVVYVLHLKFRGIPNPGWSITKRYRQFSNLHTHLMKRFAGKKFRKLPDLPGKQLFSNQRLAQERQVKLGTYVRTLLAMELQSPQVADFLGIPTAHTTD